MGAAENRAKSSAYAAYMKAHGITRTTGQCPWGCGAAIRNGGEALLNPPAALSRRWRTAAGPLPPLDLNPRAGPSGPTWHHHNKKKGASSRRTAGTKRHNQSKGIEMADSNSSSGGIGFAGLLTVAFIVLKLCKVIAWSWWWVLSPLWISAAIAVVILVVVGIVLLVTD